MIGAATEIAKLLKGTEIEMEHRPLHCVVEGRINGSLAVNVIAGFNSPPRPPFPNTLGQFLPRLERVFIQGKLVAWDGISDTHPSAHPFQDWVTREVLPAIRKDGGYIKG